MGVNVHFGQKGAKEQKKDPSSSKEEFKLTLIISQCKETGSLESFLVLIFSFFFHKKGLTDCV